MKKYLFLAGLMTLAGNVAADGYFVGGASFVDMKLSETTSLTTSHDKSSTQAFFDYGRMMDDNWSLEFGYRAPSMKRSYSGGGNGYSMKDDVSVLKLGGKYFSGQADGVYGFIGGGAAFLDLEAKVTSVTGSPGLSLGQKFTKDAVNAYVTVGAGYPIADNMAIELGYANYGSVGDSDSGKHKVAEMTLGLNYRF